MYCSALQADLDPDRLSFTEAVFQICQTVTDQRGEQEPAVQQWRTERLLQRLRRNLLAERHLRINPRPSRLNPGSALRILWSSWCDPKAPNCWPRSHPSSLFEMY